MIGDMTVEYGADTQAQADALVQQTIDGIAENPGPESITLEDGTILQDVRFMDAEGNYKLKVSLLLFLDVEIFTLWICKNFNQIHR